MSKGPSDDWKQALERSCQKWKKRALTAEAQIPDNRCPDCDGTGWKIILSDAFREAASKCECRSRSTEQRLQDAGVPIPEAGWTLAKLEAPLRVVGGHALSFLRENHDVLIAGRNGRGKTCTAVAVLREIFLGGTQVSYVFTPTWLASLRRSYGESCVVPTEYDIIRTMADVELLYLDDLGAEEKASPWVRSMLRLLLAERKQNDRHTLVSTNLSMLPEEPEGMLAFYGSSVHSRLQEFRHVVIPENVPDLRARRQKVQGR